MIVLNLSLCFHVAPLQGEVNATGADHNPGVLGFYLFRSNSVHVDAIQVHAQQVIAVCA